MDPLPTNPSWRRALWIGGAVAGGAALVAGGWWLYQHTRNRTPITPPPASNPVGEYTSPAQRQRRAELLSLLSAHFEDESLDPRSSSMQYATERARRRLGVPVSRLWDSRLERAVIDVLAGQAPSPGPKPRPRSNPVSDLDPRTDWERVYEAAFPEALEACCEDPTVISYDQAVIAVLAFIFPDHDMGAPEGWCQAARARTGQDLAHWLGPTEAEARAVLNACMGRRAVDEGADVGQAVRAMGEYAFPTALWTGGPRSGWQEIFAQRAAQELRAS